MANNNENKVLNVPHLRFPEFTEEWVNVSLKDVADFQKERISSGLLDESTYISTENILQNFQGVQSAISIPANTNVVAYKKNDILLSNIRPYLKKVWFSDRIGGCSADVFVLRSKTCEPEFLYNVIASDKFINYVMSGAKGVKMPRGDKNQMESFSFSIPAVVEQRKISRLFQLLDERIVTQNKIIEKLQSLIKGIVVSHYSTTAHIIKVRIRELGEAYSTMVMSKEQLTNDGNLCVFYGELFTLYDCVIDEVKSRTSLEKVSSTLSHGRDLLFPASTTVDAVSLIAPSALMQKDIILGGDMFGIKVSEAYNPIYLSYYFNYIANKRLAKYAKGTTIIHLHYNEIANVAIELPNIEEQDKIVSTILEYSAKLSIEETILEKLFDLKQYLLKQLFI